MILASHQPDFMPYSGFFYKMAKADIFDLAVFDQYSHQGYQRRVTMGGEWVSLIVNKKTYDRLPINLVQYNHIKSKPIILNALEKNYSKEKHYDIVLDIFNSAYDTNQPDRDGFVFLTALNVNLIYKIAQYLGIDTDKIKMAMPLSAPKGHGIIELMEYYGADTYLSGVGAKAYIGEEFNNAGKNIMWSKHSAKTGNSIVELIAKEDNPLVSVLAEI